jgi:hypothetical protein
MAEGYFPRPDPGKKIFKNPLTNENQSVIIKTQRKKEVNKNEKDHQEN